MRDWQRRKSKRDLPKDLRTRAEFAAQYRKEKGIGRFEVRTESPGVMPGLLCQHSASFRHAHAANAVLGLALAHGMVAIETRDRVRTIALIGTMNGNVMTMHRR